MCQKLLVLKRHCNITYIDRLAVRVITKNEKDEIVVIFVKKRNYYKLPGGGIEADKDYHLANEKEMKEETGCKINMYGDCIATMKEWKKDPH